MSSFLPASQRGTSNVVLVIFYLVVVLYGTTSIHVLTLVLLHGILDYILLWVILLGYDTRQYHTYGLLSRITIEYV